MDAQLAATSNRTSVDLSVDKRDYFGVDPSQTVNARDYGLVSVPERDLYRVSYLFLQLWGDSSPSHSTGYGGFQVRANTYLWLSEGRVDPKLQKAMQKVAHRGAYLFNSGVAVPAYDGWLNGFNPAEDGREYRNWEVEPVGRAEARTAQPGRTDWTFEAYLEVDADASASPTQVKNTYADLVHTAQGVGNPWELLEIRKEVEAQQEFWEVTWNPSQGSLGAYDIHPPGRSQSKERAKRLHEKTVYLNGYKIGNITTDGRVWLAKEYDTQSGEKWGDNWSKKGLRNELRSVHAQSIRAGGKLAKVDESPSAVYLATKDARGEDFDPVDPNEVDPDREIVEGTVRELRVQDPEAPMRIEVRQDEMVGSSSKFPFGKINPGERFTISADGYKWPGYRTIAEAGVITTPTDAAELDDEQLNLNDLGDDRGGE